jgi:hypothetical protein
MNTKLSICKECKHPARDHGVVVTPSGKRLPGCFAPHCHCGTACTMERETTHNIELPIRCECGNIAVILFLDDDGKTYIGSDCTKCRKAEYHCRNRGCTEQATHIRITKKKNLRPLCTKHTKATL